MSLVLFNFLAYLKELLSAAVLLPAVALMWKDLTGQEHKRLPRNRRCTSALAPVETHVTQFLWADCDSILTPGRLADRQAAREKI